MSRVQASGPYRFTHPRYRLPEQALHKFEEVLLDYILDLFAELCCFGCWTSSGDLDQSIEDGGSFSASFLAAGRAPCSDSTEHSGVLLRFSTNFPTSIAASPPPPPLPPQTSSEVVHALVVRHVLTLVLHTLWH